MNKIISFFALVAIATGMQAQVNANGHAYVDLGLRSGMLWATCNVGANSPTEYGDYFAWGETAPKSSYHYNNYTQPRPQDLDAAHDAATVNWGGDWRMPTKDELEELEFNCTWVWRSSGNSEFGGVAGYKVSSKAAGNTNFIFLPAAGCQTDGGLSEAGSDGYYWSKSYHNDPSNSFGVEDNADWLYFYSVSYYVHYDMYESGMGCSVRAVIKGSGTTPPTPTTKTVSNIPDGWQVNGQTPSGGSVSVEVGGAVTVTPANIPAGKQIKSIKAVKKQ